MICQKISVRLSCNGMLSCGQPTTSITYDDYEIKIVDCGCRTVTVESKQTVEFNVLFEQFLLVNRLAMLGEGYFYSIIKVCVDDDANQEWPNADSSKSSNDIFGHKLLPYYTIKSDFDDSCLEFANIRDYLTSDILSSWNAVNDELLYPCNTFFYMTQLYGLPIDMRLAYITESFEALGKFYSIKKSIAIQARQHDNGRKKGELFDNLFHIVENCGGEVFASENTASLAEKVVQMLVNNRNRLMHLSTDMKRMPLPTTEDFISYSRKLHILFRHTLLQLCGVDYELYKNKLVANIRLIDDYPTDILMEDASYA